MDKRAPHPGDIEPNWPHRFTPDGSERKIGEDGGVPIFARPMICIDCYKTYVAKLDAKPTEPCPARNTKRELKRLFK